jgi:hypothetical protein
MDHKRRAAKVLTVTFALAASAYSASAESLNIPQISPIRFEDLQPVFDRAIQLQKDVLSAGKGIVDARAGLTNALCFLQLYQSVAQFNSELLRLQTLVLIEGDMHDPYDARTVFAHIKDGSVGMIERIEADRPYVNRVPSNCPTNGFVAAKSQELLNLYTFATPVLRAIVSRS